MKRLFTLSVLSLSLIAGLTSCKKDYTCACDVKYVVDGKVVNTTTSRATVTATKEDDAKNQCKYYESEENYLNQKAIVQNYCTID